MFALHTIGLLSGSKQTAFGDRLLMGVANNVATPASANAVTVLGAITAGTGFTNISTVTLAPSGGTGSGLKAVPTGVLSNVVDVEFSGGGLLPDPIDELGPSDDLGQQRRSVQRSPTF